MSATCVVRQDVAVRAKAKLPNGHDFAGARAMNKEQNTQSSAIVDTDYDDDRSKLYVTFVGGKTYVYDGVPQDTYDELLAAPSMGKFFNNRIRDRYPFALVAKWPENLRHS
jgi:KTSC domain